MLCLLETDSSGFLICQLFQNDFKVQGFGSSSSDSVFIRCCPFSRDGQIYPISSAIACTPSLHLSRLRASFFFKPIFSVSSSTCFFQVFLAFSCHSLQDLKQPSKHCRHPSSVHVHTSNSIRVIR